jgi:hypothetical protein
MAYGIAALLFILGLATALPAIAPFLRMRKIKEGSAIATGIVHVNDNPTGGLMTSFLGKTRHPQIVYEDPNGKELSIEVWDNSIYRLYRYKSGEAVQVIYDKTAPWLAYPRKEWNGALRDLWLGGGEVLAAIVIWNVATALHLPM